MGERGWGNIVAVGVADAASNTIAACVRYGLRRERSC